VVSLLAHPLNPRVVVILSFAYSYGYAEIIVVVIIIIIISSKFQEERQSAYLFERLSVTVQRAVTTTSNQVINELS